MIANCIKSADSTYTPQGGSPVPMVSFYLDIDGFNDLVKVQVPAARAVNYQSGKTGEVVIDCRPRFATGGRLNWKPYSVTFTR